MKRLFGVAMVLTLVLSVAPVLAGDGFHALSRLPAPAQAALTPLDDAQLGAITGGELCVGCANVSTLTQLNLNLVTTTLSRDVEVESAQLNAADVDQAINSSRFRQ